MAGKKGRSGGDHKSAKAKGLDLSNLPPLPQTTSGYARMIDVLNKPADKDENEKDPEAAGWRVNWDSPIQTIRLAVRKFLYTMRDGEPRHTVNHLHDKPIEVNHHFELGEALEKARRRVLNRG